MGRSTHHPVIHHNSHPHPLFFYPSPSETSCAACSNPTTGAPTYTCKPCNHSLHASCTTLPPTLSHPSHPSHDLTLLFSPAGPEGSFDCDACGKPGTGFSYHCKECGVDVHALCGLLPAAFLHPSHFHPLSLKFSSPYEGENYECDVCEGTGEPDCWMYRCSIGCEFDAHLGCVLVATPAHGQRFQLLVTGSPVQEPQANPRGLLGPSQTMPDPVNVPGNGQPDLSQLQGLLGPSQTMPNPVFVPGNGLPDLRQLQGMLRPSQRMPNPVIVPGNGQPDPRQLQGLLGPSQRMPNPVIVPGNGQPNPRQLQGFLGASPMMPDPAVVPGNAQMVQAQLGGPHMLMQQPMSPAARHGRQKPSVTDGIARTLLHGTARGLAQGVAQQVGATLIQGVLGIGDGSLGSG